MDGRCIDAACVQAVLIMGGTLIWLGYGKQSVAWQGSSVCHEVAGCRLSGGG